MNIPKPPKLFFSRPMTAPAPVPGVSGTQMSPPPMTEPTPTTLSSAQSLPPVENPVPENERVWSPGTNPIPEPEPIAAVPPIATAPTAKSEPTAEQPQPTTAPLSPTSHTDFQPTVVPAAADEDDSRFSRPDHRKSPPTPPRTEAPETVPFAASMNESENALPDMETALPDMKIESGLSPIERYLGPDQKVVRAGSLSDVNFSDIWYTAEKIAYIRDQETKYALVPFEADDLPEFYKTLEQGFTGASSYAIRFAGETYRVERIMTLTGIQYNCRKMPTHVPDIYSLGLPKHVVDYLLSLSTESGLILFGGPTGMGKTTSASALMKRFLEMEGGFMYTIEDPPEMPLDGLYHAQNGGLGLCKQCPVENEHWGDGIKSALRSRPRYILVGEIRTPETASQVLRAATSGHLVFSTIHASTVEDALESLIKYAAGSGLTEELAADLLARGILAVVHQKLEGTTVLRPVITAAFANPHLTGGDQMRSLIRSNTINLQTLIESQSSRLFQGRDLFSGE